MVAAIITFGLWCHGALPEVYGTGRVLDEFMAPTPDRRYGCHLKILGN